MKCVNPYTNQRGQAFGCGQCLPCLFNRRRVWAHRIMLEASLYQQNAFVTLTYRTERLRTSTGSYVAVSTSADDLPSLQPQELQNFLKRFRKAIEPERIRFFACAEYGDSSERPHYHLALFNFPSCAYGQTRVGRKSCCFSCDLVREQWGLGNVYLGSLEDHSAQYVAGYVTKKMTRKDDERLRGRVPEFSRQSNRPGIGHDFMFEVASTLMQFDLEQSEADVPSALRHGKRVLPLGRYLRRKLRLMVGRDENTPESEIQKLIEEMRPLQIAARSSSSSPSLKSQILEVNKGKVANLLARQKLHTRKKTL